MKEKTNHTEEHERARRNPESLEASQSTSNKRDMGNVPQLLEELRELKKRIKNTNIDIKKDILRGKAKSLKEQWDKVKGCRNKFETIYNFGEKILVRCPFEEEGFEPLLCPTCQKQNEEFNKIYEELE